MIINKKDSIWDEFKGKWKKEATNPILQKGLPGSWDVFGAHIGSIIKHGDLWYCYYSGWNGNEMVDDTETIAIEIGLAISKDGIKFKKYDGNPVFCKGEKGEWDQQAVDDPWVIKIDDTFHMWYGGYPKGFLGIKIGHAVSKDGIHWTRKPKGFVLDLGPEGSWDEGIVNVPSVLKDGDTYYMWYSGLVNWPKRPEPHTFQMGLAISKDGNNWTKVSQNPVLGTGKNSWDSNFAYHGAVIKKGKYFVMCYAGTNEKLPTPSRSKIGLAVSLDGINWTKYNNNPILESEKSGWEYGGHESIWGPLLVERENSFWLYYSGHDGTYFRGGLAYLIPNKF
ncbi:MAG: hypothetical protein AABY84_00935 [Candidatus Firestonebacteria bacterium]